MTDAASGAMNSTVDYSVIIPAYNEERRLGATLDVVREAMASLELIGELIVVNNNSTDATEKIAQDGGATVVFEPVNQISRARNAGGRAARSTVLLFIDADTHIAPELLREAVRRLKSGEYYGGGARIAFDRPLPLLGRWFTAAWNRVTPSWGWFAGCFVYCLKEAFDEVGGFPDNLYAGEELYFARRLKKWGKPRSLRFSFIADPPVVTSARRLEANSPWSLLGQMFVLGLFRPLLRSKWFCRMWYHRPSAP